MFNKFNCRIQVLLLTGSMVLGCCPGVSQVLISGLTQKGVYTDGVTFTVQPASGFDCVALLNGVPVGLGSPKKLDLVDYHELALWATNRASQAVTNFVVRFVVLSGERKGTEKGLPAWTPLPPIPSSSDEMEHAQLRVLLPASYPPGMPVPVVVWVEKEDGSAVRVNGSLESLAHEPIRVLRGVGSGFLVATNLPGPLAYTAQLRQLQTAKRVEVEDMPWVAVPAGVLSGTNWPAGSRVAIGGNVTIPAGTTVRIGAGTVVKISAGTSLMVDGSLIIEGTEGAPVVFCPAIADQPWGGFYLTNRASVIEAVATIFTGSGADPNAVSQSHRREQCLFYMDNRSRLALTNCAAISLAGQFGHGVNRGEPWSQVVLSRTLVQRCTTGGEWNGSSLKILNSALIEMPAVTPAFNDGDEDGLYFTSGQCDIRDSLIGWTRDDGLDAGGNGGGTVNVSNTWMESIFHEAFAWSGGNRFTTNRHTVVLNCGQAFECGYSSGSNSPNNFIEECLSTANLTGVRFADNYDWTYNGFVRITNSILIHNHRDVWAMNWADWSYRTNAMDVQGNRLSVAVPQHPNNTVWQPDTHGDRLAPFMSTPANARVGVGLALWSAQLRAGDASVPVRLSSFSPKPVSVDYHFETPQRIFSSGTLVFAPGETVRRIALPAVPAGVPLARLTLLNPVHAEITGLATAWVVGQGSGGASVLVSLGATWKYLDSGEDAGTNWVLPEFDDSLWKSGPAELGYGDSSAGRPEATVLSFGSNSGNKHIAYYFRHAFDVADPSGYGGLSVGLQRDDGGVVYLNGREVFRSNMPDGVINYLTRARATADDDGTLLYKTNAPAAALVRGRNVLAVGIHQDSPTSSDVSFDLQLEAMPAPRIDLARFGEDWLLVWSDPAALLEEADDLAGPWTIAGRPAPVALRPDSVKKFYRLKQP